MLRFILTALSTGILFGIMDGLINANPLAVRLMECYKAIAKQKINVPAGIIIDILYGFAITGIFYLLRPALPSGSVIVNGLLYGTVLWFFRVLMNVLSSWMMFNIPAKTLVYMLFTGLAEMLILGVLNGLLIR